MIFFLPLLALTGGSGGSSPPAGTLAASFTGIDGPGSVAPGGQTASMGTVSTVRVQAVYGKPGDPADSVRLNVRKVGGATVTWDTFTPAVPSESFVPTGNFNSTAAGWSGAGTYVITFVARRVSTGAYDVTSNEITLTVS